MSRGRRGPWVPGRVFAGTLGGAWGPKPSDRPQNTTVGLKFFFCALFACMYVLFACMYYFLRIVWLKVLARGLRILPRWALRVFEHLAPDEKKGGLGGHYDTRMGQGLSGLQSSELLELDLPGRIRAGYVCRKCGEAWQQPPQGYSQVSPSRSPTRPKKKQWPVTPPPGLGTRPPKVTKIQKATAEILAPAWSTLEPALQGKLKDLSISPPPPTPEPDLKDVLVENMAQLPPTVRELVEKLTRPAPPTEKDVASKLKAQVTLLEDLSHRKSTLQGKIDFTKKAYQDLLDEMKGIQTRIEAEQQTLTATSASYMSLVNAAKPDLGDLPETGGADPVPDAVAGFINTLGVSLTEEQQQQLQTMLKRPPAEPIDEAKRCKKEAPGDMSCG